MIQVKSKALIFMALPVIRQLVIGLSPQKPEFKPQSLYVGAEVDKVHWERFFCDYCRHTPPMMHYSFIYNGCYTIVANDSLIK